LREEILNLISSFLLLVALFKLIIFIIVKLLYLKVIDVKEAYWLIPNNVLINMLKTDPNGLSSIESSFRLSKLGNNRLDTKKKKNFLSLFLSQFKSPIIIIFVFTALLSFFLGEREDALIIFAIILISSSLGFWQEKTASDVIHKLISTVKTKSKVLRDGKIKDIVSENIVSGDIIILESGDKIPADCKILESKDIFVNEATLTGETYPIEKSDVAILNKDVPLRKRLNSLFMGTFVISGTAKALVIHTGANTEIGKISSRLNYKQDTEFQKGIKQLGYFLVEITLLLVISIFLINVYLGRPVLESFLFPLALAIGLTPQLLPTIISINLSHGARRMANEKVIVKRPESIENLGSMDILCTDKTGTITTGELKLYSYSDINGHNNEKILLYAYLNAMYETGYANPIDKAIKEYKNLDISNYSKLDEIPYDCIRKRLSIAVSITENTSQNKRNQSMIITKGALQNILDICSFVEIDNEKVEHISTYYQKIIDTFKDLGNQGFRVLGIAHKIINENSYSVVIDKDDETDMIFLGFLIFFDPIKSEVPDSLNKLHKLGVSVKIITGDNRHVAKHVAQKIGLTNTEIVIGEEVHHMSSTVLAHKVTFVDIFAEIEPNQKEQIILALRKAGYGVGYIGDGINDAPALHAADASISVDTAADVVKEAADIVLLEKDLKVIVKGIEEGRKTFSNTLKYIFMATSANFGNMFSMAGASSFLSFLPLLPKQVLLLNLITDIPEMAIATDNVDKEMIQKPRKMNIKFIRKFMLYFGLLSTLFDFITFGILIVLNASIAEFRTIWFMESLISASLIILIIRTKSVFYKSRPSKYLIISIFSIIGIIIVIPYTVIGKLFGFVSPPLIYLPIIGIIVFTYICMTEVVKKIFYKNHY
jgi:Mg2+-importing ATPase